MNPLDRRRPAVHWLSPLLGLALLLGSLAPGLHHHRGAEDHRGSCAVCSAGHAAAVIVDAAPTPGALFVSEDPPLNTPELAHARSTRVATSPRAPPLG